MIKTIFHELGVLLGCMLALMGGCLGFWIGKEYSTKWGWIAFIAVAVLAAIFAYLSRKVVPDPEPVAEPTKKVHRDTSRERLRWPYG
jgi:predicted MFS family arabinose efflux permease